MLVKLSTDKTVSEAAAALLAAVQANHFDVMQVHNLKETMAKKGVEFARERRQWPKPAVCGLATKDDGRYA